jgi:hypothetical protein
MTILGFFVVRQNFLDGGFRLFAPVHNDDVIPSVVTQGSCIPLPLNASDGIDHFADDQAEKTDAENVQKQRKQLAPNRRGEKVAVPDGGHGRHHPIQGVKPGAKRGLLQEISDGCAARHEKKYDQGQGRFAHTHHACG